MDSPQSDCCFHVVLATDVPFFRCNIYRQNKSALRYRYGDCVKPSHSMIETGRRLTLPDRTFDVSVHCIPFPAEIASCF